jgi:hypothetical protein
MPERNDDQDEERRNRALDTRFLTPLLLMGTIIVCGLLYYAYTGQLLTG